MRPGCLRGRIGAGPLARGRGAAGNRVRTGPCLAFRYLRSGRASSGGREISHPRCTVVSSPSLFASPSISQRTDSGPELNRAALDYSLLAAVADGDRRAFVALYRQFSASVHRMVHSVIRDPAQAEEISQEVFLAIWREAGRFDPLKGSVSGYISMLAHAKAVDRVRSSQAARTRDENYTTKNIDRNEHHDPVVERTMLHDESVQIRVALGGLTAYQREAIELYYFDRHTYLEVGQMLGVSAAAVKARVRGAVLHLRNRMSEMDREGV